MHHRQIGLRGRDQIALLDLLVRPLGREGRIRDINNLNEIVVGWSR